jgi:Ca2+-binding RTX toxin-like protein
MAFFTGTATDEQITPTFVSSTVTRDPAGSFPGDDYDNISGGTGNDVITSGGGNDTIYGDVDPLSGTGKDRINAGYGDDFIYSNTGNYYNINGGAGYDYVSLSGAVNVNLNLASTGIERLDSGDGNDNIDGSGQTQSVDVRGGEGNDTIRGSAYDDVIYGGIDWFSESGKDIINAGAGADTIYSYTGNFNNIIGGAGRDHVSRFGATSVTLNLASTGIERLDSGGGNDNIDGAGQTQFIEVRGSEGNDTIRGSAYGDTIYGDDEWNLYSGGEDTLNGGAGADTMVGGLGNDTYFVDNLGDVVDDPDVEGAFGGGIDKVQSSISYTLGSTIEVLTLADGSAIDGTGNTFKNVINGNNRGNVLSGLNGNDTLNGLGGNDILDGGNGNDRLNGADANDTINGGNGADRLNGGNGADRLNGGSSADDLSGYNGSDLLTGGSGRDVLKGGTGSDRFDFNSVGESPSGLLRDDILDFSGAGGHADKIDLASIDADLTVIGNQAFASGQLSFLRGVLTADVKGGADFQVQLTGAAPFNLFLDVVS